MKLSHMLIVLNYFQKQINLKMKLFIDEAMHNNLYDFGIEKNVINFSLNIWK